MNSVYKGRKHCSTPSLTSLTDIRQTRAHSRATAMSRCRSSPHKAQSESCSWQTQEASLHRSLFGGKTLEGTKPKHIFLLTKASSCVLCQPLHRKVKFLPEKSLLRDSPLLSVLKTYYVPPNHLLTQKYPKQIIK